MVLKLLQILIIFQYCREKCIGPDDLEFLIDAEHDAATSSIHHSSVASKEN